MMTCPAIKILTSDVYEWAPGGFFVFHYAYGRIGNEDGGAVEIIGYDQESKTYRIYCFDSSGVLTQEELTVRNGVWTSMGKNTRFTGTFRAPRTVNRWRNKMAAVHGCKIDESKVDVINSLN